MRPERTACLTACATAATPSPLHHCLLAVPAPARLRRGRRGRPQPPACFRRPRVRALEGPQEPVPPWHRHARLHPMGLRARRRLRLPAPVGRPWPRRRHPRPSGCQWPASSRPLQRPRLRRPPPQLPLRPLGRPLRRRRRASRRAGCVASCGVSSLPGAATCTLRTAFACEALGRSASDVWHTSLPSHRLVYS